MSFDRKKKKDTRGYKISAEWVRRRNRTQEYGARVGGRGWEGLTSWTAVSNDYMELAGKGTSSFHGRAGLYWRLTGNRPNENRSATRGKYDGRARVGGGEGRLRAGC